MIFNQSTPTRFGLDIAGRPIDPRVTRLGTNPFGYQYGSGFARQMGSTGFNFDLRRQELDEAQIRQQQMQSEEYLSGSGLREQQRRQSMELLPLQAQQERMQIGEYLGGAGLREQQQKQSMELLPLRGQQERMQIGEYLGGAGLREQQAGLAGAQTRQAMELLPLQGKQQQMQIGEYLGGAGLRGAQQRLSQAETDISLSRIGDVGEAGRRAYTFGREEEELNRLRMASEGRKLQSQMSFLPQSEAIRGGIMGRIASSLNINLPQRAGTYSSGTGYTPSWMQSYQTPQFPRY